MSAESACLALVLDAPLMSFGHSSRFQRRTTALYPTRSAICGMICAAAGAAKGSRDEAVWLGRLESMSLTVLAIPRQPQGQREQLPIRRLEDYHTVRDTRRASGEINRDAVISHRQYLLDARFGVLLGGCRETLEAVAGVLRNPRWGVWFGRKSCIPAAPIVRGLAATQEEALTAIGLTGRKLDEFDTVADASSFAEGTDTIMDIPLGFGKREFKPRRIVQQPAQRQATS